MANFTETCTGKLSEDQKKDLRWRWYWIAGREYYRVTAPDSMKGYDEIAVKSYPIYTFDDGNADLNAYLGELGKGIKNYLPGWDDAACSFDQKAYACFCAALAEATAEDRKTMLASMASGKAPAGEDVCDHEIVEKDPVYNTNFPGVSLSGKTKMWPWLLGIGVVGVVGAVVLVDRKSPQKAKKNPGTKRELEEMKEALRKAGYDPSDAKKLQKEGMGIYELEGRIRMGPTGVGSLWHSHRIHKIQT